MELDQTHYKEDMNILKRNKIALSLNNELIFIYLIHELLPNKKTMKDLYLYIV